MNSSNNSPPSFLIVKTSAIGDVVQSFPVLEYLRSKFPQAKIDWVVEEAIAPLLRAHPLLDEVIPIQSKAWSRSLLSSKTRTEFNAFMKSLRSTEYDYLFDLQGNTKVFHPDRAGPGQDEGGLWVGLREGKIEPLRHRGAFQLPLLVQCPPEISRTRSELFSGSRALSIERGTPQADRRREDAACTHDGWASALKRPRWMVCIGSRWVNKRIEESTMLSFLRRIADHCDPSFLFIYGNEEEQRSAEQFAASFKEDSLPVGALSLPLWQALMWEMDGVIAVDSAALHLCGTTETPSFSVFGPTSAAYFKPTEERHFALQGPCPYGKDCPSLPSVQSSEPARRAPASASSPPTSSSLPSRGNLLRDLRSFKDLANSLLGFQKNLLVGL